MGKWTRDTDIGGRKGAFPETPPSAVLAARSDDPLARGRGFATLIAAYWKPVYKQLRIRFGKSNEDAKDLTQAFFTNALEREIFSAFDPGRARFRIFVRTCLRNFVLNADSADRRLKRGGGAMMLSVDFDEAESELTAAMATPPDEAFERDLEKSLESLALTELERTLGEQGKENYFEIFERYYLAPDPEARPTYAALAVELGIKTTDVTNHLAFVRKKLKQIVLIKLREITASDEEFRDEARELLGIDASEVA